MKNAILTTITIILIPIAVISFNSKETIFFNEPIENTVYINLNNEDIELETYLVGVVAAEMPASFEIAALEAQAITARTYAYKKYLENKVLTGTTSDQAHITVLEMQEKWGNDFQLYYDKISNAVNNTKGLIITYHQEPITAFYFSMSNGQTEPSELVFKEELPYITEVTSNWETNHNSYIEEITFTKEELIAILNIKDNDITFSNAIYSDSNNLISIEINNNYYEGTNLRHLLNLRSTDIEISTNQNLITIKTKGYGHGVGMSQYGANGMAQEGFTYEEIIKYYYKDVEIEKI